MSPTQRTLADLKARGYRAGIVERWIAFRKIRIDLFNIIDIVAIKPTTIDGPGHVLGVQSTGQAFSEHLKKLTIEKADETRAWLESGARLELYGWRKLKVKRGKSATRWTPRIQEINLSDLKSPNTERTDRPKEN